MCVKKKNPYILLFRLGICFIHWKWIPSRVQTDAKLASVPTPSGRTQLKSSVDSKNRSDVVKARGSPPTLNLDLAAKATWSTSFIISAQQELQNPDLSLYKIQRTMITEKPKHLWCSLPSTTPSASQSYDKRCITKTIHPGEEGKKWHQAGWGGIYKKQTQVRDTL